MDTPKLSLSLWNWVVIFFKGKFGGGLSSVIEYILDLFNDKVLSKISVDDLKKYSGIILALIEFCEKVLRLYEMDEAKRIALQKTVDTLRKLSVTLQDGKVTPEELEQAIEAVVDTINAWKSLKSLAPAEAKK